jgi:antibiotic biosynthesis monooxygenase (ABM) superfamily enzyme
MSQVEDYCLGRAWQLRLRPADSRWLIGLAISHLATRPAMATLTQHRQQLTAVLSDAVHERYGNPVVVWILLYVVVPVIVRLIIEWWFQQREQ